MKGLLNRRRLLGALILVIPTSIAIAWRPVDAGAAVNVCEVTAYAAPTTLSAGGSFTELWTFGAYPNVVAGVFNQNGGVALSPDQTDWMVFYPASYEVVQGSRNDAGSGTYDAGWFGLDYQC